ncbi:hypothetical protein U1Q18_034617, partial [Sarracenia purpurea var. burkii]
MTMKKNKKKFRGFDPVCYFAPLDPPNLQWISTNDENDRVTFDMTMMTPPVVRKGPEGPG